MFVITLVKVEHSQRNGVIFQSIIHGFFYKSFHDIKWCYGKWHVKQILPEKNGYCNDVIMCENLCQYNIVHY